MNSEFVYYKELSEPFPEVAGEIGKADSKFLNIEDNTYINGNFQRMSYIEEHQDKICDWLTYDDQYKVTDYASEDYCVIQFRGGDYTTGHSMLPPEYYQTAMKHIVGSAISEEKDQYQKNISLYKYPGGPVSIDYSILNTAKYAIISASTFAFWPIWTNKKLENVIAPMYWFDWSRSNGWWRPYDGIVKDERWLWLHRDGNLYSTEVCLKERDSNESN